MIRDNHWGLINNVDTFKSWIADIIESNNLKDTGIFFIWDEFTDYLRHGDDQVVMQQISEFCKEQPLFMCFIVHKDSSWVDAMGNNTYQQITHRFHEINFHVSPDAAYDLIAGSISIRNGMEINWKEAQKDPLDAIRNYLPDISGIDDPISEKINLLCPMHPMTIKLLSQVAENFAAAQRTMFRFMKDTANEGQGFSGYISQYGPLDEACWLTPDWLWDYFFTRDSDFHDKDTKVPEYIRHYESNKNLVENDEKALRVFKTSMLLMSVMSTTRGLYNLPNKKSNNGISSTVDCLKNCLCGVISDVQIDDYLKTFADCNILLVEELSNGTKRIQLPFHMGNLDAFQIKYDQNDKKYTFHNMFTKDGWVSSEFEKLASKDNVIAKRIKIVTCCPENTLIDKRTKEVTDDLDKNPFKLGIIYVAVKDDSQAVLMKNELANKVRTLDNKRLVYVLINIPFDENRRKAWLNNITREEMSRENGNTADATRYHTEALKVISDWANTAKENKMNVWYCDSSWQLYSVDAVFDNILKNVVFNTVFPYAPENIVETLTAYKPCNDSAPEAGITRESKNSQNLNVLTALKSLGILDAKSIHDIEKIEGSKSAISLQKVATLIRERMESGSKVVLDELWSDLQKPPFGYYNSITTGILLGFIFSFYKNSEYSWTDSAQSGGTFSLDEKTLKTLVLKMCRNQMETDYLSAGSVTWQSFRLHIKKVFNLNDTQTANEIEGMRSIRECITTAGAPVWSLKYLSEDVYGGVEAKEKASNIFDNLQVFVTHEEDSNTSMNNVIELFQGQGKLKERISKAFNDKSLLYSGFFNFISSSSPQLEQIVKNLGITSENLRDKIFSSMQSEVYTWTESQVSDKLPAVVSDYTFLSVINTAMGKNYLSLEAAIKDLKNAFVHMRVPIAVIEQLKCEWVNALVILKKFSDEGLSFLSVEDKTKQISILQIDGAKAWGYIKDSKDLLRIILDDRQLSCTEEELSLIFVSLKDISCDASINQFDQELKKHIDAIEYERECNNLNNLWTEVSDTGSIKEWCKKYCVPLKWIMTKEYRKAIDTLYRVQNREKVSMQDLSNAYNSLKRINRTLITDLKVIEDEFLSVLGMDYITVFNSQKEKIITELKLNLGNDISDWSYTDIQNVKKIIKKYQDERDKKEKLADVQQEIQKMEEKELKDKVSAFLYNYPEYCDAFVK